MLYISGYTALNLPCKLMTQGVKDIGGFDWATVELLESGDTVLKDYGIEEYHKVPGKIGLYNVANTLRALIDLISWGKFETAKGMRRTYIANEEYTAELFEQIEKLDGMKNWGSIDRFMGEEYGMDWLERKNGGAPVVNRDIEKLPEQKDMVQKELVGFLVEYMETERLSDLRDLVYMALRYWDTLDPIVKTMVKKVMKTKGQSRVDYIRCTQPGLQINFPLLKADIGVLWDKLDLI